MAAAQGMSLDRLALKARAACLPVSHGTVNTQRDSSWQITPQGTAQSRPEHFHFFRERSLFACPGVPAQRSLWPGPFLGATQVHSGNRGRGMQPLRSPSAWLQLIHILGKHLYPGRASWILWLLPGDTSISPGPGGPRGLCLQVPQDSKQWRKGP